MNPSVFWYLPGRVVLFHWQVFLTVISEGKSQMVRADHCRGDAQKAVMNVNRQVSAASAAPLEEMNPSVLWDLP